MISRSYAWIDENAEHSESDDARAAALAKKWSELQTVEENRLFARMSDIEDGRDTGPEFECGECEGSGAARFRVNRYGLLCVAASKTGGREAADIDLITTGQDEYIWIVLEWVPESCRFVPRAVPVTCQNCKGEGVDRNAEAEYDRQQRERQAERDLEIELVEDKLRAIGARMCRPYEHWNEDERYMQYMEEGRFGQYSN